MKKVLLFALSLMLLVSCTQTNRNSEDIVSNRLNRDGGISFMGLRLGMSNDSVESFLLSSQNFTLKDFPDFYSSNADSDFDVWDEDVVCTFFCTIVDSNNDSHGGWGKVKSDVDSVTTIYYYIPSKSYEIDSIYERLKPLFVERYGEPDEDYETGFEVKEIDSKYEIVYNEDVETTLYDKGCFWDFANNQRIYLNKSVYLGSKYGGIFSDVMRVEIVYRDMKVVKRIEKAQRLKQQQEEKKEKDAEEERIKENMKRREEQQL